MKFDSSFLPYFLNPGQDNSHDQTGRAIRSIAWEICEYSNSRVTNMALKADFRNVIAAK